MELRQISRERSRRVAAELSRGSREAVFGQPDRVARKLLIWTPEIDLRVLNATPEDLIALSRELDASVDRLMRRRRAIMASVRKEMLT